MERLEPLFDRFRQANDAGALAEVFDALAPDLLRLARHLVRDRGEAEDLVQATFLAAIEHRASFDASRELRPWLAGILIHAAARVRRARSREIDPRRLDARSVTAPDEALAARELSAALALALDQLPPAERELLGQVLLDGRRAVDVARELGARPDTVHMRVHRGLTRLRRLLPAGFGLGVLAKLADARSLAHVKRSVLEGARLELSGAPAASAVGASAGLVVAGGLAMKNVVLVSAALLAAVAVFVTSRRIERPAEAVDVASGTVPALARSVEALPIASGVSPAARLAIEEPHAPPTSTRLELVDSDDVPVVGARVAYVGAGGAHASTTDDTGACELPRAGTVDLYVRRDTSLSVRVRADLSRPSKIALPPESEVSGRVALVDGSSPQGLELALASDRSPEALAEAAPELLEALGALPLGVSQARATLDESGRFRFRGLSADWTGSLRLPPAVWLREDGPRDRAADLVLPAPARELRLTLDYRPSIRGRLIDAASRAPIGDVKGFASLASRSDMASTYDLTTDAEGRFRIVPADTAGFTSIRVFGFRAADGRPYATTAPIALATDAGGVDLGDVACRARAARAIRILAVDTDEQPVRGARVVAGAELLATTDVQGRAEVAFLPLSQTEVFVAAPGFAAEKLAAGGLGAEETVVRLRRSNRITAIVLGAPPGAATQVRVGFAAPVELFEPGPHLVPYPGLGRLLAGEFAGASPGQEGAHAESRFRTAGGRVEIDQLRTDVGFDVRLLDPFGLPIASVACAPLGPSEQREVRLLLPDGRRSVAGRVVDEQGRPLDRANVRFEGQGRGFDVVTGADGRFRLEHVVLEDFRAVVSKRGFVSVSLAASDFPSDGSEHDVRLESAHDVRVLLVDATGARVAGARVDAAQGDRRERPAELASGEFALLDLSEGELALTIDVGGAHYERVHRSTEPLARFELPAHGRVEVTWPEGTRRDARGSHRIVLRPSDPGRRELTAEVPRLSETAASFPAVLPGAWEVAIESSPPHAPGLEPTFAPVGAPTAIEVRPGVTTRLELLP